MSSIGLDSNPLLKGFAKKFLDVIFLKVDVNELKNVAEEWMCVEAMPIFVLVKKGKEVDRVVGANKDGLLQTIEKHGAPPATVTA